MGDKNGTINWPEDLGPLGWRARFKLSILKYLVSRTLYEGLTNPFVALRQKPLDPRRLGIGGLMLLAQKFSESLDATGDLTTEGRQQAVELGREVARIMSIGDLGSGQIGIVSSPAVRARTTANIAGDVLREEGIPPTRNRVHTVGDLDAIGRASHANFITNYTIWRTGGAVPPNLFEDPSKIKERSIRAFGCLMKSPYWEKVLTGVVLVVTHIEVVIPLLERLGAVVPLRDVLVPGEYCRGSRVD